MQRGFQNTALDVRTGDGSDDILLEPLLFVSRYGNIYRAPTGSTTDGLSTPKIIRNLPGYDATGEDWFSGVLHDAGYRNFLEVQNRDGVWQVAALTQAQCDALILEAMESQGVGYIRRHMIYSALVACGGFAFREDRKAADLRTGAAVDLTPGDCGF